MTGDRWLLGAAVARWLLCLIAGHDWSKWVRVHRIHTDVSDVTRAHTTTNDLWLFRMCERGHVETRGYVPWDGAEFVSDPLVWR